MFALREYQPRSARLADFLPWAGLVAPGVVLNKDGSFQRTARIRGPDLDSATAAELMGAARRMNAVLRRLGSGWALYVEARRIPSRAYPRGAFPDPVSALVDAERRAQFEAEGAHFDSRYFLTLQHLPPAEPAARGEAWLYAGRTAVGLDWRTLLAGFIDRTDRLLAQLEAVLPQAEWLDDAQTLTFLHGAVSTIRQGVAAPETPMHLDALLADQPLTGGLAPRLGDAHLRVLTVAGFPASTWPGLLDELNRLAFPYRWTTRAICLDKLDAARALGRIRRQWFAKRKSVVALLKEVLTQEPTALIDTDAENKALDADAALQDLGADAVSHAYVTATVCVWDPDEAVAEARLRLVEKTLQGRDFICRLERLNAVEAWLGGLPGHAYANVRQPPISTLNLAHMAPLSAVWAGPETDGHLEAAPLLFARTEGATPFRLALHVGDVGHTLVVGPTGAGKSVLLALMALQFRRYAGAQVFIFDHGGSSRAAALAMGGQVHDLGGGLEAGQVALQPLAGVDRAETRAWAADWLAGVLGREGVVLAPSDKAHLWSALQGLAGAPPEDRSLSGLVALLADNRLKQALAPFTIAGPWGRLLDAEAERLGGGDVEAVETEGLMGTAAAPAVLAYLFQRLALRLDGRPTLVIIDEGWLALDDPVFSGQLRAWLKTLRKKNAAVVLASQTLADLDASPLAATVAESCATRIFLPNDRALEPQAAAAYARFGLNARQIQLLAEASPKRDYYCQSRLGARVFELGLGPVALALCAASSKADQARISAVLARHGPDGFAAAWLAEQGLTWAADLLQSAPADPISTPSVPVPHPEPLS